MRSKETTPENYIKYMTRNLIHTTIYYSSWLIKIYLNTDRLKIRYGNVHASVE